MKIDSMQNIPDQIFQFSRSLKTISWRSHSMFYQKKIFWKSPAALEVIIILTATLAALSRAPGDFPNSNFKESCMWSLFGKTLNEIARRSSWDFWKTEKYGRVLWQHFVRHYFVVLYWVSRQDPCYQNQQKNESSWFLPLGHVYMGK